MQWISAAITLPKLAQRVLELVIHFCTECVDSAILLPLTVINTNITMVISQNQLLLRDTQKHCNFWAWIVSGSADQMFHELRFRETFYDLKWNLLSENKNIYDSKETEYIRITDLLSENKNIQRLNKTRI